MATKQVSASASGLYPVAVALNQMSNGASIGILVTVPNGVTVSYTVQVSGDPATANPPTNLNPHDTLGTAKTASANGSQAYPVQWIVLNVASISGGAIVMSVIQADALAVRMI